MPPFWYVFCIEYTKYRKMKNVLIILYITVSIPFLNSGCAKTTDTTWVVFNEENCLPPWVSEKSDNKTRKNLSALLKGDGIIPLKIKIKGDRLPDCNDCNCLTGKSYHVQIDESQLNYIYHYGFYSE